ncbi:AhpC/TSA family protein [Mucilaginibacter rubeus]|uniref:AhpC/TSA family protein n=1 Tax=Mucilaginibacter rubeus TaxID=2027860 RepID=A0AAE6JCT7_9SPHI|nr:MULTISPECIES: TlpA disulfide reductase family protein [Mucilaginibacter]QEM02700.1 AhpC/TSA family protein [Mucilaginibacter rubeus]QEM15319.1 AhpC/TSA family protein [Mucilaginibacter gossypii]QTE41952.1 AhpC/TSA family protein [Mucilaginibacter rubeus]QTE48554.1 AhpC/TSA family protein [Mucilaginibacter rubeus]QTE59940.1 AhpC/TSA family protein [Mucilaginibacter rubeus]
MKKLFIALLVASPFISTAQNNAFTIKGAIENSARGDSALMRYITPSGAHQQIATPIINGHFTFNGTVAEPVKAEISLKHKSLTDSKDDKLEFYLMQGTTIIQGKSTIEDATVSGTRLNEEYRLYRAEEKFFDNKYQALEAETNAATEQERKAASFKAKQHIKEAAIDSAYYASKRRFAENHTASIAGILALGDYAYTADYSLLQSIFNKFGEDVKASKEGRNFTAKLEKLKITAIGKILPDFAEPDADGNLVKLSSLRGKYVLIDFWAPWCTPCRAENPNVVKAYEHFHDKGFTVLGISLDGPKYRDNWLKAIKDDHLSWTQVSEFKYMNDTAAKLYGINAIPQNFLIDPEGRVIAKNLRGEALEGKLKQLLTRAELK